MTVSEPDEVVATEPVMTSEDDYPALATEGDAALRHGGRTDNSGEAGQPEEPQDPDTIVTGD